MGKLWKLSESQLLKTLGFNMQTGKNSSRPSMCSFWHVMVFLTAFLVVDVQIPLAFAQNPAGSKEQNPLSGTVLLPNGTPASAAKVSLSIPGIWAEIDGVEFHAQRHKAEIVVTDRDGKFSFPQQPKGLFAVIAVHESGVCAVPGVEFQRNDSIKLMPWGRVEGRVLIGKLPDAKRLVNASVADDVNLSLDKRTYCVFRCEAETDDKGEFVIPRMIPGNVIVSRVVSISRIGVGGTSAPGWQTAVPVSSGEMAKVTIGGVGRPVIGRLVPDSRGMETVNWKDSLEPVRLTQWDTKIGTRAARGACYLGLIDESGSFQIPDVPPGQYQFSAMLPALPGRGARLEEIRFQVSIPEAPGGQGDEPFDLEEVEAVVPVPVKVGDVIPELRVRGLAGGLFNSKFHRGKLLLLDFWLPGQQSSVDIMQNRRLIHEQFRDNPRFSQLGIACNNDRNAARDFSQTNGFVWQQGHVSGAHSRVAREFTSGFLPTSYLIGPDGRVLAKNLDAEDLPLILAAMLKDDALFVRDPDKKSGRFPILRYPTRGQPEIKQAVPAIVVLDDTDPAFADEVMRHDGLRLLDSNGAAIWAKSGLNNCSTIAGNHRVFADQQRNRIYVAEVVTGRLIAFDLRGHRVWQLEQVHPHCLAVDAKTGNLWCGCGRGIGDGSTVVFNPQGDEVATFSFSAMDIAYDPHSDAFWLVQNDIVKLNRQGTELFRKTLATWTCAAVSVNPTNGQAWVAERLHEQIPGSKNRLWLFNADGSVRKEWDFGDSHLYTVACVPKSGDAWIGFVGNGGIRHVSHNGPIGDLIPLRVSQFSVSPTTGAIWTATRDAVLKLDSDGKTLLKSPFRGPSSQAWLHAF
ncbi:MAG: resA 1 [Planctomycetaceae bacterium]|nr:resA 1 [Planctomycetaceae bacterium]